MRKWRKYSSYNHSSYCAYMNFPHKKGFLNALIQQNGHVIVTFSRWDFWCARSCQNVTSWPYSNCSLIDHFITKTFTRAFLKNISYDCNKQSKEKTFFGKDCKITVTNFISAIFYSDIYSIVCSLEKKIRSFWLITYQKNIVSATINLPLFQLAKTRECHFE